MTGRRDFIGLGAGALLASLLPEDAFSAEAAARRRVAFRPRKATVTCGLARPFTLLHVSDTHLALMDEMELRNPKRAELHSKRAPTWQSKYAEEGLAAVLEYAKAKSLPIVHTGDLVDFIGEANLAAAGRFASDSGAYCVAGNHEWAFYMFTGKDDFTLLKDSNITRMSRLYRNDLEASARVIGGVNFVSFDNWDFQVGERQDRLLRAEFEKGLPTVILCHCPFYAPKLHESEVKRRTDRGAKPATGLMGTPPDVFAELLKANPREKWRAMSPRTAAFVEWALSRRNLKAVLCGHLHRYHEEEVAPGVMQYVADTTSSGGGYEVTFV